MAEERSNVIELDAHRPHICLHLDDGSFRVISCRVIEAFLDGDIDIDALSSITVDEPRDDAGSPSDDWQELVRKIVREWYTRLVHG